MDYQKEIIRRRLEWVEHARQGILAAIGDDIIEPDFKAFPTDDPIKFILEAYLRQPLATSTRAPLRKYMRLWARLYDCEVPIINISAKEIRAEVYTKGRHFHGQDTFTSRIHSRNG